LFYCVKQGDFPKEYFFSKMASRVSLLRIKDKKQKKPKKMFIFFEKVLLCLKKVLSLQSEKFDDLKLYPRLMPKI